MLTSVHAQTTAAEILEKARGQARDLEELRKVLNGPDQNMRLATFDAMAASGDPTMRNVAIDVGMASADSLLQAAAFREVVMGLDSLIMTLVVDTSAPDAVQEKSTKRLDSGTEYVLQMAYHEPKTGKFAYDSRYKDNPTYSGFVTGTTLIFKNGNDTGTLELKDDNAVSGVVNLGKTQFIATARIR